MGRWTRRWRITKVRVDFLCHFCQDCYTWERCCISSLELGVIHRGGKVRFGSAHGCNLDLLTANPRSVVRASALRLVKVSRAINYSICLLDCTLVLKIVSVVRVTRFLDKTLRQRLGFVLHIFLKLVRTLAQGRPVYVARPTSAFLPFIVLVHQV